MRLLFLLTFQLTFLLPALCQKPMLYVLLPSEIRPHAMRTLLVEACPDLEIKVFPRYSEFWDSLSEKPPDAFLALRPVTRYAIENLLGQKYQLALEGLWANSHEEPYIFLAEKPLNLEKLEDSTIGALQILDRRAMATFLSSKFGGSQPKPKTVTKLEDLLSLLQFNYADAIFVPKSKVEYYQGKSKLVLNVQELPGVTVGLPELMINEAEPKHGQAILEAIKNLPEEVRLKLGVQTWSQQ